jgi:uracil-DNA glycosylase
LAEIICRGAAEAILIKVGEVVCRLEADGQGYGFDGRVGSILQHAMGVLEASFPQVFIRRQTGQSFDPPEKAATADV